MGPTPSHRLPGRLTAGCHTPGARSAARPAHLRGVLLLAGAPEAAASWAGRGTVPMHVVPLERWTALLPAGPSLAASPYDEGLPVLAARPVSARLRAALGFFVIRGRAVVTVQPGGWRSMTRWAVWEAASGVARAPGLPLARPGDLVRAAGVEGPGCPGRVRDVLLRPAPDPLVLLVALMQALELPGTTLLQGAIPAAAQKGWTRVEPDGHTVARFDASVRDVSPVEPRSETRR